MQDFENAMFLKVWILLSHFRVLGFVLVRRQLIYWKKSLILSIPAFRASWNSPNTMVYKYFEIWVHFKHLGHYSLPDITELHLLYDCLIFGQRLKGLPCRFLEILLGIPPSSLSACPANPPTSASLDSNLWMIQPVRRFLSVWILFPCAGFWTVLTHRKSLSCVFPFSQGSHPCAACYATSKIPFD